MAGVPARPRVHVCVTGTVQGVGFRPHVHRLAGELGPGGLVLNDERGFLDLLHADAPLIWSGRSRGSDQVDR